MSKETDIMTVRDGKVRKDDDTVVNFAEAFDEVLKAFNVKLTGSSIEKAFAITPNDSTDLTNTTIALYVGVDGDVKVDLISGNTITLKNLSGGVWHPIRAKRVYATGTTATSILGAW